MGGQPEGLRESGAVAAQRRPPVTSGKDIRILKGASSFSHGSFLILTLGIFCSVFDLIYIRLLAKAKPAANA